MHVVGLAILLLAQTPLALAAEPAKLDPANTAWMIKTRIIAATQYQAW